MKLEEIERNSWIFRNTTITDDIDEKFSQAMDTCEAGDLEHAEILLLTILAECPNHIDTIHNLSLIYDEQGREIEAYVFCQAAVSVGLQAIPGQFEWSNSKLEWAWLENRPFMRAYDNLGLWHLNNCRYDDAIEIFERLLSVNPNDNQGIRYLLPICWFEKGELSKIVVHCRRYADDIAPEILYSEALALAGIGRDRDARTALRNCVTKLPLIAKELLKKKHPSPKSRSPGGYVTSRGADEAYAYWKCFGKYWQESESAMELLNQVVKG